ncbi:hypothetical protein V6N13_102212 [Hibiscus sabdariffa]
MVDGFIEGHARNQRPHVDVNGEGEQLVKEDKKVIYEDVSLDRDIFRWLNLDALIVILPNCHVVFRSQRFEEEEEEEEAMGEEVFVV